jgi:alpha-galactosidase
MPIQKPTLYHPLQIDANYASERGPHGSWIGAVEIDPGKIVLAGSLDLDAHVFLNGDRLTCINEHGEGDWLIVLGTEDQVFRSYAEHLERQFVATSRKTSPRVWCSWYSLYASIDEEILAATIDHLNGLPFDVIQVDDGWQESVGDWNPNAKFPSGMSNLANRIRSSGRRAGLWLAPLIACKSSDLFRRHPGWFLKDEHGKFVSAGFNWGEHVFALDTTLPVVQEWLAGLMRQVREWGFDYLKLDFLYGGALEGERHEAMPRERAYRKCLELLRQSMGEEAYFLTCGTPILPALGVCDAMRIGPDVDQKWEKTRDARLLYNFTTPGTKNAIRTTLHRLWLKRLVDVDPDVVYFTDRGNDLTKHQKRLLQDLARICGFKATSDMPQWLTENDKGELKEFLLSNSVIKRTGRYSFQIDGREVDFTQELGLPAAPKGSTAIWSEFLGWLGNQPSILRWIKAQDDKEMARRREDLRTR